VAPRRLIVRIGEGVDLALTSMMHAYRLLVSYKDLDRGNGFLSGSFEVHFVSASRLSGASGN
jgi:hypothetical protein